MSENFIEIKTKNGLVRGMIHIPESKSEKGFPVVILFHGFTGNRMEPKFMFVRFSRLLMEHGIASVRFDFWGSGESEGSFDKMTFSGELQDARDILDYVRSDRQFDRENIFLLGLSMGGSIAGCLAGERGNSIRGLILWSAAGEMKELLLARKEEIEREKKEAGAENINVNEILMDASGLVLGEDFIRDIMSIEIMKKTSAYNGDVLILHSDNDSTVPLEVSYRYKEIFGERGSHFIINGGDHTFQKVSAIKNVFEHSLRFIKNHL